MLQFQQTHLPRYSAYIEDYVSRFSPDYIVAIETRGARLVEAILERQPHLQSYQGRLLYHSAIRYLGPAELSGRQILLIDDSAYYGRSITRVRGDLEASGAHVIPIAFAACDAPDVARLRKNKPHFDSLDHLSKRDYANRIGDITTFLRNRGPLPTVDATSLLLRYRTTALPRLVPTILGCLAQHGPLTALEYQNYPPGSSSYSLHWPTFFDPGPLARVNGLEFDGILKLRASFQVATDTMVLSPLIFPTVPTTALSRLMSTPHPVPEFERLRTVFQRTLRSARPDSLGRPVAPLLAYDFLGLYFDLRLLRATLGILSHDGLGPCTTDLPHLELSRYYGPWLAEVLEPLILDFLGDDQGPQASLVLPMRREDVDLSGLNAHSGLIKIQRTLHKTFRDWNLERMVPKTDWQQRGETLPMLAKKVSADPVAMSAWLDYLCDTTLLVPLNQLTTTTHGDVVERAYRGGEYKAPDPEVLCAWVIYFLEQASSKPLPSVSALVVEKSIALLHDAYEVLEFDTRIAVHLGLHGPRPVFQEPSVFLAPRAFQLDALHSPLYSRTRGQGYSTTEKFKQLYRADSVPLPIGVQTDIEDCLDRLLRICRGAVGVENLTLAAMLAAGHFGLSSVGADLEISVREIRDAMGDLQVAAAQVRPPSVPTRKRVSIALHAAAIADRKVQLLYSAPEVVTRIRSNLQPQSRTRDRQLLDRLRHVPRGSPTLRMMGAIVKIWHSTLDQFDRGLVLGSNARVQSYEQLSATVRGLRALMGRPAVAPPDRSNQDILSHAALVIEVAQLVLEWATTLSNAKRVVRPAGPGNGGSAFAWVVDLTGFTKASFDMPSRAFNDASAAALNVVYGWLSVFGACDKILRTEGDKIITTFDSTVPAVHAAVTTIASLDELRMSGGIVGDLGGKIGIDAGEMAVLPNHDVASRALNTAARFCDAARGVEGHVLITQTVYDQLPADLREYMSESQRVEVKSGGQTFQVLPAFGADQGGMMKHIAEQLEGIGSSERSVM